MGWHDYKTVNTLYAYWTHGTGSTAVSISCPPFRWFSNMIIIIVIHERVFLLLSAFGMMLNWGWYFDLLWVRFRQAL